MRAKHRLYLLLALLLLLSASACNRDDSAPKSALSPLAGTLQLSGSNTMKPLLQAIALRFSTLHPGVHFEIESGGSSRGIEDVRSGKSDIGMASKVLADDAELIGIVIARDGGGILLHRDNPVTQLSDKQVRAIFTGRLKNWRQVGGANSPIHVIERGPQRGLHELFLHYYQLTAADLRSDMTIGDNSELIARMLAHPNAITFFSIGAAEQRIAAGAPLKLLAASGVAARRQTIEKGDYPIARPLTLVTRGLPRGLAKAFIEYARSPAVHDLVEQHEFVPYLD